MEKIFCLLLLLWIPAAGAGAQTASAKSSPPLSEGSPGSAGVSAERLARMDEVFETAVRNGNLPGIVALMARNGKIVYHKAFGMANNHSGQALEKDDIFRIASQTRGPVSDNTSWQFRMLTHQAVDD